MFIIRHYYKKLKNEKGSLSVETTIFLSLFIVFFVCMINIMQLVIAQIMIQFALNQTAKEISQFSYVFAKADLDENFKTHAEHAATLKKNTKNTITSVNSAIDSFNNLNSSINELQNCSFSSVEGATDAAKKTADVVNNAGKAYDKTEDAVDSVSSYIDYLSTSGLDDIVHLLKNLAEDKAASLVSQTFVRNRVTKHLNTLVPGGNADAMLKSMGVVNGVDGLSCIHSSFYVDGSKDFNLVLEYKINYKMPFLKMQTYSVTLRASTGLW